MERKLLGKHGAALIIFTVIVIAVLTAYKYTRAKTSLTAVVTSDGATVLSLPLDEVTEKREFTLDNGMVIAAENGEIWVESAPCKDKICVRTGKLSHSGESAVCVPLKTVVSVKGASENIDVITY